MSSKSDTETSGYPRVISSQFGRNNVTQIEEDVVLKQGSSVWPSEEAAIKLIQAHTADIPVPTVYHAIYNRDATGVISTGMLYMEYIPGKSLESVWPRLSEDDKKQICQETWGLIERLRQIPRPEKTTNIGNPGEEQVQLLYCAPDGTSHIVHPLLGDLYDQPPPLLDDEALRTRIWERYVEYNGLSYPDGHDVKDMLPRSETSVFTHGDIHPGNILVKEGEEDSNRGQVWIVGLVDFESAGFFPEYWEFAEMMRFGGQGDEDEWRLMMERTAPRIWDVKGIQKARRVLF
ncbi:hypothetical protein KVR01_005977 [Diaporthe batatas]|uniref:uncharacterized protein n=1 Tax=Diaporthe batatas TaxID=748121 RepID=UPI001D05A8CC|nr:uncharacterized protein KVR01_005977 [Diaporthe batatas]KAG8164059.1 hypothetical protein KVR01_005977 [Diaporthe batatas]